MSRRRALRPIERAILGVLPPLLIAAGCLWLLRGGHLFCPFYELTGLYCPGCGSGRAATALLRGHVAAALGHNALLFLLGLPAGILLGRAWLGAVFPGLNLQPTRLPGWVYTTALLLVLGFWLLRNLPAFPFLAP